MREANTQRGIAEMLRDPRPIAGGALSEADSAKLAEDLMIKMKRAAIKAERSAGNGSAQRPAIYTQGGAAAELVSNSLGEAFIESDAYRGWVQRFPSGGPSGPGEFRTDPHEMQMGMRDATRQLKARSLVRVQTHRQAR